eukprot:TRINITY_DN80947_c0_g1_i2.p1 TRINITY_DN80947_c0_g1~~TRINITY_DN80947_c0_g1_i2.p1  ORF type:complete len:215 (+),score=57.19 TRINITY_DN80947_c0_g1_i2:71-646(+)
MCILPTAASEDPIILGSPGDSVPAPKTLGEALEKMKAGSIRARFDHDAALQGEAQDQKEACGACLLDKVDAIVVDWSGRYARHLLFAMAACCTKDEFDCAEDVAPAYALLEAVDRREATAAENAPQIAALLIEAAAKRLKSERVAETHTHYLERCRGAPKDCTMAKLGGRGFDAFGRTEKVEQQQQPREEL